MPRLWKLFLAWTRWDLGVVCEMSKGRGKYDDFHDYPDSALAGPVYMYDHICVRCGKVFCI